ncbi:GAF domain-like protein [Chytridium lagenaria]|nr:GAF domain-like protein [Chytridium lagenaria]
MSPTVPAANPNADPNDKAAFYKDLVATVKAVIDPSLPLHSNLANISAVIFYALVDPPFSRKINWAGFYLTDNATVNLDNNKPPRMILGPFQGRVACTMIPFGKGVCGTAAKEKRTVVVEDSEIVVPIVLKDGTVAGVLDIDCLVKKGFDEEDRVGMDAVVAVLVEGLTF